ncbi:MAG TPA: M28 family peptidase [Chitinophagaceae bacterium]|nr:M28 family peptidase [Chitinophagaceae bacterium]
MKTKFVLILVGVWLPQLVTLAQITEEVPLGPISPVTGLIIKDDVTRILIHNSSGDRAHNYVQQLALWDRQQNTKEITNAAHWIEAKAKEFGLKNVEIENYLSNGKTEYFGSPTSLFWKAKKGDLWATSPYLFKITSYADLPMSLASNSYSIKDSAELVDIGSASYLNYQDKDLKGKIVLTSRSPSAVYQKAVLQKGAIGVISHYSVPYWDKPNKLEGDFPDQVGWAGMPASDNVEKQSFAFMISERKAKELRELLRQGKVNLFVDIETEKVEDNIEIVSGVIPGSKYPDEEIIITAHLDHYKPGADDNASGCAVILEMIRTLNYLIDTKQISRPLRTIRFLWLPEFSGTMAWFSRHLNDKKTRILNLNFDMLGANAKKTNSSFFTSYTPDWNGSFINAYMTSITDFINKFNNTRYPKRKDFHISSVNGTRNHFNGSMQLYSRGSDHQIFNDFHIPGVGFNTWPDDFYHSSEDTPDKIDPTQLHRVTFLGLASLLMTGWADAPQAYDITSLIALYGAKRLQNDEFLARQEIMKASKENFENATYFASKILNNGFKREKMAMESLLNLCNSMEAKALVKSNIIQYDEKEALLQKQLEIISAEKAKSLGLPVTKHKLTNKETEANKLVPARQKDKELVTFYSTYNLLSTDTTINYDEITNATNLLMNELREQEVSELRIYQFEDIIAGYGDGKKSFLEIRDAMYVEYGVKVPLDIIEKIFKIFEKAGAIKINKR